MQNGNSMAVYPFQLPDLSSEQEKAPEETQVNVLADVAIDLEVELGRTQQRIGQILEWEEGTVITLDKLAGESAEVLLNSSTIARGEVMVIDGKLALRVVEISGLEERLGDIL